VNSPARATRLTALLTRDRELRAAAGETPAFTRQVDALRGWQAARLERTYADLGAQPRYAGAIAFFLQELYGAHDATPRDHDLARASHLLERALPDNALQALERAIALEILSQDFDLEMARVLPAGQAITGPAYADAYRAVGRRIDRERQIDALVGLGAYLDTLVRKPGLGLLVRLARGPAHAAGFAALHDFLERGFAAFGRMKGAEPFLATIRTRETLLLERAFGGDPDPFGGGPS
jgi:hypothetical protein